MTFSRTILSSIAFALGAVAGGAVPTLAGGDAIPPPSRTVTRVPAAVPVPAPVPVPEVATGYYLRLDAAYASGDVSKYRSTERNADLVRADSYLDNYGRFGFGAGYQFSKWIRADLTVDWRNDVESRGTGNVVYRGPNGTGGTSLLRDTISDSFTSTNVLGMANAYIDLPVSHSFTPYFGAGIGFVRHQLKGRIYSRSTTCIDLVDCDSATLGNQPGPTLISTGATTAGGVDYGLATALMAGFTYKITENGKIDIGYRWLHLESATFTGRNTTTVQNLTIPDQNVHEMRVGLRYDIN